MCVCVCVCFVYPIEAVIQGAGHLEVPYTSFLEPDMGLPRRQQQKVVAHICSAGVTSL